MKKLRTALLVVSALLTGSCSGQPPTTIGVLDHALTPCPSRPNCVASMGSDADHHIDPISYSGEKDMAVTVMKELLLTMNNVTMKEERSDYLYAEARSRIFGFVDDVEFYFDNDAPRIHLRSASRLGYSDLGVNRKRLEHIRTQFSHRMRELATR